MVERGEGQRIGQMAVDRGLITAEQLEEALQEFHVRRAAGGEVPLGEVLVELGLLTRPQLAMLLGEQPRRRPAPAQPVRGYELISKLGEGGMGATYLARQASMDRLVALKILRKQFSRDPAFVARFQREAQLAGKLDHVNIVAAIEVAESGGLHYLAMEYVEGRSASELLPAAAGMDQELALDIVTQIARALDYAHRHGVVHRDIKPDNILVTKERVAKLCDFGLACRTGDETRLTQAGMAMGTPNYISPEQARGERDIDVRSDIYSLGATFYHLVTGRTPFEGDSAAVVMTKHLGEQAPWPRDVNPEVSEHVCRIIERMMAKSREGRYGTPAELVTDLELVAAGKVPRGRAPAAGRSSIGRSSAGRQPARAAGRPRGHRRPGVRRERSFGDTHAAEPLEPVGRRLRLPRPVLIAVGGCALFLVAIIAWALARMGGAEPGPVGSQAEELAAAGWASKVAPLAGGDLGPAEAGRLLAALETFKARYGETRFAAERSGEIAALRARVDAVLKSGGEKAARELLAYALEWRAKHPGDFAGALERLEQARRAGRGTVVAMEAEDALKEVEAARARADAAKLEELASAAGALAAGGDYDAALAALALPPAGAGPELAAGLEQRAARLRAEADAKFRAVLDGAAKLGSAGRPGEALEKLGELSGLKYAPAAGKLAALRARLEREQRELAEAGRRREEQLAREALAASLDGFEKLVLAGRFGEARDQAGRERSKLEPRTAELVGAQLEAAGRVASALLARRAAHADALEGLVGWRGELRGSSREYRNAEITEVYADGFFVKYDERMMGMTQRAGIRVRFDELAPGELERLAPPPAPRTADEFVGEALLLVGRAGPAGADRDALLARAGEALGRAGQHPLVGHYRERLRVMRLSAPELAAEEYWKREVQPLAWKKPGADEAGKLLAALDGFAAGHGGTGFAKTAAGEVERLRALARAVLRGTPEGMAALVPGLFRGKVEKFDPRTLMIELLYDFEEEKQLEDFQVYGGKWKIEKGYLEGTETADCELRPFFVPPFRAGCTLTGLVGIGRFRLHLDKDSYHWFVDADANRVIFAGGKKYTEFARRRVRRGTPAQVELVYLPDRLVAGFGGEQLASVPGVFPHTRLSLTVGYPGKPDTARYDDLRVVGTLHRPWLLRALEKLEPEVPAPTPAPHIGASPWRGAWRKMKGSHRCGWFACPAFDTKRGWYVTPEIDYQVWAYAARSDSWEQLSEPAAGDGKSFPKQLYCFGAVYDPERDLILAQGDGGVQLFHMATRKWSNPGGRGTRFPALCAGGGTLLRLSGKNVDRYDYDGSKWVALPGKLSTASNFPADILVYDAARKRFVLFGGAPYTQPPFDATWCYDPAAGTWKEVPVAARPPARHEHGACYDSDNGLVVIHGGFGQAGRKGPPRTDTWVFDAKRSSWFEIEADPSPPPGTRHLEYDPTNKCCIAWNQRSGEVWILHLARAR
jgi:serine/threonine-protein kinase